MSYESWEADYPMSVYVPESTYEQPRSADTVTRDIVTQRQDVGATSLDQWGGFFKGAVSSVLDYGIKRDAAMTGVQLQAAQRQNQAFPGYYGNTGARAPAQQALNLSPNTLLLIGGIVVAVMVLKK